MMLSDLIRTGPADDGGDAEEPPSGGGVDISIGDERWDSLVGLAAIIPRLVQAALLEARLSPEANTVSVALLSDAELRKLNRTFRGKDEATNVLSFPAAQKQLARKEEAEPAFLGDVALAFETVVQEAAAADKPALDHAAHLVVHGVLHLVGFDHQDDRSAEQMEAAESAVLAHLGFQDPYRDKAEHTHAQ